MNLKSEKLKLIQLLIGTENPIIIEKIKQVFQAENQDIIDELSLTQKEILEIAIQQSENEEVIDFESFLTSKN